MTRINKLSGGEVWRRDEDTWRVDHPSLEYAVDCKCSADADKVIAGIRYTRPIPVSERLPEDGQQVMAYDESNPNSSPQYKWQGSIFEHGSFFGDWSRWDTPLDNVTHWLPMPPTPE